MAHPNDSPGVQNVDVSKLAQVLALQLNVVAALNGFDLEVGNLPKPSTPSTAFLKSTPSVGSFRLLCDPVIVPRDAALHRESSAIMSIARDIERHYLEELFVHHLAELLGIVRDSAAEIEVGTRAADSGASPCFTVLETQLLTSEVLHRAESRMNEQQGILLQSVQVRLDARDGQVVSQGGHDSLWQSVESQHVRAMHIVKPLLLRLTDVGSVSEVQADVAVMLRDKEKELENLFSDKYNATESLNLHEQSLAKTQKKEEAFADAAVELAMANPTSSMVQQIAIRAIARVMHLSTMAADENCDNFNGCLKESWEKYLKELPEGLSKRYLRGS